MRCGMAVEVGGEVGSAGGSVAAGASAAGASPPPAPGTGNPQPVARMAISAKENKKRIRALCIELSSFYVSNGITAVL